jgi:DNA-directed RNA polymerase subunit H
VATLVFELAMQTEHADVPGREGQMSSRINVLDHDMVPNHQVMSEDEVKALLARYSITFEQLPKVYHDDAAVKQINGKVGDVIQVVRQSQTAGIAEAYRLVIRRPKK